MVVASFTPFLWARAAVESVALVVHAGAGLGAGHRSPTQQGSTHERGVIVGTTIVPDGVGAARNLRIVYPHRIGAAVCDIVDAVVVRLPACRLSLQSLPAYHNDPPAFTADQPAEGKGP